MSVLYSLHASNNDAASGLKIRLINVNKRLEITQNISIQIHDECVTLVSDLDDLRQDGFATKAREAAMKAMNAQTKAEDAERKIKAIVDRFPETQRNLSAIETSIDDVNNATMKAQVKVQQVQGLVPNVTDILSRLSGQASKMRQLGHELRTSLRVLWNNISVARDQANLIRVGMDFINENSSLQVRNPRNLMAAGFHSRVSLFFKTTAIDGLLFYTGPTQSQTTWNYMSLQLIGGKAVFKFDLGSGPASIANDKFVSDGVWHEAIMIRIGRNGTLTIRSSNEPLFTAEGGTDGESFVLNFDNTTGVFIGGMPETKKNDLRDILPSDNFVGCIQDVSFDGAAVGLWNFEAAKEVDGCISHDIPQERPFNGYMFGGNGYVILDKDRFNPTKASLVKFSFRTFASDGLMFLMGIPESDFLAVELKDGKVIYKYDLGSGQATIVSTQRYNDGKWHSVSARRQGQDGALIIDSIAVATRSPGIHKELNVDKFVYFGGFKGRHTCSNASVTQKGFEGCIKDIELGTTRKDINEHIEVKDVLPGCPETTVRVVSFTSGVTNSYVSVNPTNTNETSEILMKFKTVESDGLLFYATDSIKTQGRSFSLSLSNGKVVATNVVDGRVTALQSNAAYNDGFWHYLTVRKDGQYMSLNLDDSDRTTAEVDDRHSSITDSTLFFGGLPPAYTFLLENVTSSTSFVGCIGDVIIGQEFVNFADVPSGNVDGIVLNSCHIPDPTPNTTSFTIVLTTFSTQSTVVPTGLPSDKCFLPVEPLLPDDTEIESGFRFGSRPESRQEYRSLSSSNTNRAEYSVEFRTTSSKGVIFYVANKDHVDFVGIYINKGLVTAAFNCGGGLAKATSTNSYNDGQWHTLVFRRNLKDGTLTIDDGAETISVTASGSTKSIEVTAPYYVGGLPLNFSSKGASNLENVSSGFVGCLRNFSQNGTSIGNPDQEYSVFNCSSFVEVGTFFYTDAGHLVVSDNFTVGLDLVITLEIKPRTLSGVLFSVHNEGRGSAGGDYLVLQMVNGEFILNMDNGRGDVSTKYTPPAKNQLCDGQWHTIRAQKAKNVVVLEVDKVRTAPGSGVEGFSNTNTKDPLYAGGVPVSEVHRGILTNESFVGCMRLLEINNVVQDFTQAKPVGRIKLDSCPTT